MALTVGSRLGPFEIVGSLGRGGMGEVWRARDTRLKRDVALKVLPDGFASDRDRIARFQREAELLATLNHPNIAAIYGLEDSDVARALALELVEGETLAEHIARGPIGLDEALSLARQIADALDYAHEHGVLHRDLKPANIKVTPDGKVKVLDFGLAKAIESVEPRGSTPHEATITTPAMTQAGVLLGTAAYMSPEQARGKAVDRRADIWAFGCVLYEMLTGMRLFEGETVSDTLAAVLKSDPEWNHLPAATSTEVRRLLRRCLARDPKERLRDIGDARYALANDDPEIASLGSMDGTGTRMSTPSARLNRVAWSVAALSIVALVATAVIASRRAGEVTPAAGTVQFTIVPPEGTYFGGRPGGGTGTATQVAVSPDGRRIAFVAGAQSAFQIYLRPVATLDARPIPGTEGGAFPFWSPDGEYIGFFAGGKLKKVQIAGGPPIVLCDAPTGNGGSWNRDGVIVFAPGSPTPILSSPGAAGQTGLMRVSSAGGVPTVVTDAGPASDDTRHRWPHFLPDGRHFIYTEISGAGGPRSKPSTIRIGSLDAADPVITLLQAESSAVFASGHLLFAPGETLMAQPFDPDTRHPTGEAFPLAEHVSKEGSRYMGASASENGTLVYARDSSLAATQLTWLDRAGRTLGVLGEPAPYLNLALSPDEHRVAVSQRRTGNSDNLDIWIIDIARNVRSRLTVDSGGNGTPLWSPDGTRIAFQSRRSGKVSLRQQLINGTAADESLVEGTGNITGIVPSGWSADGHFIAYTQFGAFPRTSDVWILPLSGDREPFLLVQTAFLDSEGVFSPDVRWIAYTTNEGGQPNIFVQPFPATGRKFQVSRDGGSHPVWRADGRELFYIGTDGTLMAVAIGATGQFDAGAPLALFPTTLPTMAPANIGWTYAVTKDGQRFLVNARSQQDDAAPLIVVVNWTAAFQK